MTLLRSLLPPIELHNKVAAELATAGILLERAASEDRAAVPAESATARRRRTLLGMAGSTGSGRGRSSTTTSTTSRSGETFIIVARDTIHGSGLAVVNQFVQYHYPKMAEKVANSLATLASASDKGELGTALHEVMNKTPLASYLLIREVERIRVIGIIINLPDPVPYEESVL